MGMLSSCINRDDELHPRPHSNAPTPNRKTKEATHQDLTLLKLKTAQDKVLAQKKGLQKNIDKCSDEAKKYIAEKKRDRAVFALKRQKLFEQYLLETEEKYLALQKSIQALESAITTSGFIELLKETNQLIKQIESANGLEQMQDIATGMQEREQRNKEFNALFTQSEIEDRELDEIYDNLEGQIVKNKISLISKTKLKLPDKQTSEVVKASSDFKDKNKEPDFIDQQLEAAISN